MRILKILLLVAVVVLIVIQFLPSRIPENKAEDDKSIIRTDLATEPAISLLKKSCFDCHSNQVDLPWYSRIAPSSWILARHIKEGQEHLNFSEWDDYSKREKLGLLEDIADEVRSGKMPIRSYLLVHRDARLDDEARSVIVKWSEEASAGLLE